MIKFLLIVSVALLLLLGYFFYSPSPKAPIQELPSVQPAISGAKFTFAVVGDTRKANPFERLRMTIVNNVRQVIIDKIAEQNPSLLFNTGDLVLKGSKESLWDDFDKMNQVFKDKKIPYYPVLGNHEYKGGKKGEEDYFEHFPSLNNQHWYTITYSNSAFIMLDSNFDKLTKEENAKQIIWLEETLTKYQNDSAIAFIFVFFHHPPFTNSRYAKPDKDVQEKFVPVFERFSKIKYVFAGHVHSYERFIVNGINYIVTGGGGAPLVGLLPSNRSNYSDEYAPAKPRGKPAGSPALMRGTHFCLVTVGSDFIELKTEHIDPVKLNWSEGDDFRQEYLE